MIPRTALALFTLSALALAACGSDDDTPDADETLPPVGAAPSPADLDGLTFESTAVTGHELVADSTITLSFQDDLVSANAGCNTMNGGYTITDGALEVDAMATTMMACADDLMAQDTWLSEFLTSSPAVGLDGTTLTLTGDDASITLAEVEDAALVGTVWVVTGTVATEAVSSVPADAQASITITDETVAVDTGCNTGSGGVEVAEGTLTFGPIATTMRACDDEIMQLEAAVLAVLQGEVTYEIDGPSLSLRADGPDGEIGLELTAS
jgi:heat shock protein HslJ